MGLVLGTAILIVGGCCPTQGYLSEILALKVASIPYGSLNALKLQVFVNNRWGSVNNGVFYM